MTNKVGPEDPFHPISDSPKASPLSHSEEDQKIQGIAKKKKNSLEASSENSLKNKPLKKVPSGSFIEKVRSSFLQVFSPSSWRKSTEVNVTSGEESYYMKTSIECNREDSPTKSILSNLSSNEQSELDGLIDRKERSQNPDEKIAALKEMMRYIRESASVFPTLEEIKSSIKEVNNVCEALERQNASIDDIDYMKEAATILKEIALVQDEIEKLQTSEEGPFGFENKYQSLQNELFSIEQLLVETSSEDIFKAAKRNLISVKKEDLLLSRQEYLEKLCKMELNSLSELNKLQGKVRSVEREKSAYPSAFTALHAMFLEKQCQILEKKISALKTIITELKKEAEKNPASYEKYKELEDAFNEDWKQIYLIIIQPPKSSMLKVLNAINNQTNYSKDIKEAFTKLLRTGNFASDALDYKKMCSLIDLMHTIHARHYLS